MNMIQKKWEKRATVRSRARIEYDKEATGYYYPISRTPLAVHPKVIAKGEEQLEFLLIQSFYKYSNDIASIETRVVNEVILKAINNQMPVEFSEEQKLNLYTIMVDEAYHAYVAFDTKMQIEEHTGIKSLPLPKTIEIEKAIEKTKQSLDVKYHNIFELICVCIAENTLTKEIVSMTDKDETHPFFQKILVDHLADETRHSGIFYKILGYIWENLEEDYKKHIGIVLADYLEQYLDLEVQIEFDKQTLEKMGLTHSEINQVISETYGGFKLTKHHPMLKNIMMQLDKACLLDQFTLPQLKEKEWI